MVTTDTLSRDALRTMVPAAFADDPSDKVSDRYSFLPTTRIIDILDDAGWKPWDAQQVNGRCEDRRQAGKHLIRFRNENISMDPDEREGDVFPEMLLINSHDGLSTYQLRAGLFRIVCSNGMVVSDNDFGVIRIRHQAFDPNDVYEASEAFCENIANLNTKVNNWREIRLSTPSQRLFAIKAARLRFDNPDDFTSENVGMAHRDEDRGNSLWATFNRCQENLLNGGWLNMETRRRVRKLTAIQKNVNINADLWDLASEFEERQLLG